MPTTQIIQMTVDRYTKLVSQLERLGFKASATPAKSEDIGHWDCSDNFTVVITTGVGVTYTRGGTTQDSESISIINQLCPKGRGKIASQGLISLLNPESDIIEIPVYNPT